MAGAPMSFTPLVVANDMQTQKAVQDSYAEVARRACEALRHRGLDAETRTRFGEAGKEIVAEAFDWPADLVVVGSHDRSKLKRLLLGSTASHVVQHAPCSVEVARSTHEG